MIGRVQDLVPEVYVNESRDFALLARAYDCIIQGVKFDIDSTKYLTDTSRCNDRILQLLQTKVGFFSDVNIDNADLRYILRAFPELIRNKGSYKAIKQAIYVYLKISNVKSDIYVYQEVDINNNQTYTVRIGIEEKVKDVQILDEILKYILPAGYLVEYFFYKRTNLQDLYNYEDSVLLFVVSNHVNSVLRGSIIKDSSNNTLNADYIPFSRTVGSTQLYDATATQNQTVLVQNPTQTI